MTQKTKDATGSRGFSQIEHAKGSYELLKQRLVEVEAALTHASIEVIDWQSAAGKAEERLDKAEALLRSWLEVEIGSTISIAVRKGSTAHYFEALESVKSDE